MKTIVFASLLVVLSAALGISHVSAGESWEDPALCVNSQWLVVNAAAGTGVQVTLPQGTVYETGSKTSCGKLPSGVNLTFDSGVVVVRGSASQITVKVDGAYATPQLTVNYGSASQTQANNGTQSLVFQFELP